ERVRVVRAWSVPAREAVHGDRKDEEHGRKRGRTLEAPAAPRTDDESDERTEQRDPRDDRGAPVSEMEPEVAGPLLLERDSRGERDRQEQPAERTVQHGEAARERDRERDEAGGAARLG